MAMEKVWSLQEKQSKSSCGDGGWPEKYKNSQDYGVKLREERV